MSAAGNMAEVFRVFIRGFSTGSCSRSLIKDVTVIGGGLMGSGIAQVAAQAGQKVTLVDINEKLLGSAKKSMDISLRRIAKSQLKRKGEVQNGEQFIKNFVENAFSNLTFSTDIRSSIKTSDLVVEAIIENLAVKQELFENLDSVAPEHTILATNTSSLSVTEIGKMVKRKEKYGGLHFFNPVPMMKLLEVIRTDEMSNDTYAALMAWGHSIGKTCITCKDTPGFVVNRLLLPLQAEAIRMAERGDATTTDIDLAMKLGASHPMGPFELADYTGLDTAKYVMDGWHQKNPDNELFKPMELLNKLVREGKYGVKNGEGFYKYNK